MGASCIGPASPPACCRYGRLGPRRLGQMPDDGAAGTLIAPMHPLARWTGYGAAGRRLAAVVTQQALGPTGACGLRDCARYGSPGRRRRSSPGAGAVLACGVDGVALLTARVQGVFTAWLAQSLWTLAA